MGIANFWAIRLTEGGDAELLFPGMDADGVNQNSYWAYDVNAQNGASMPPTMPKNPFPGWKPGDRSLTTAQVQQWLDWYIKSSTNTVDWQITHFNTLGL